MAELDYAFLADYAQIEGGKLSALGASYTHVESRGEGLWMMSVAGRVRIKEGDDPVTLSIRVVAPEGSYSVANSDELKPGPEARAYGDKVGILFAVTIALPVFAGGLYQVLVSLDGKEVRRLAFDMSVVE